MPVVKTPHGFNGFSPYTMTQYHSSRLMQSSCAKMSVPYIDVGYSSPPYDGYNDLRVSSFSQSMYAGPLFTEADIYDSGYHGQCPFSLVSPPSIETGAVYDDPLDSDLFPWPYHESNGYDPSFSFADESSPTPFSPNISCSPRSDHSGMSLSPPPHFQEYGTAFGFDFATSLPNEFPSTSTFPSGHLRATPSPVPSSNSHSPTPSSSSLDTTDIKSSPSRDSSPLRSESDQQQQQQQQRRRFPCLIIGCERRFTSQYTLKVHMEAHKPKPRSSFPCTHGCAEKFSRQHDRLRHEVAKHGKICEFSCDDCGRFFSTRKTLGNHKCPLAHGGTRWVNN